MTRLKRCADVWVPVTDTYLALRILTSLHMNKPIDLYGHHGYVLQTVPDVDGIKVLLMHTGPQTCDCPVIQGREEE